MNTRDSIKKLTTLRRNDDVPSIRVLIRDDVELEERRRVIPIPRPARNAHLMMFDDESLSSGKQSITSDDFMCDKAQIICSVLGAYGGEVPGDKEIERFFSNRVNEPEDNYMPFKASGGLPNGINSTTKNFISEGSRSEREKCQRVDEKLGLFSRNILMKNLVLNGMESMSLESPSSSSSGKDYDSDCHLNTPEFVEILDEPDVLLRPEMMDRGVLDDIPIDDGFRFAHHGVKKTITPRRYLMDNIDDEDLFFKKKQ